MLFHITCEQVACPALVSELDAVKSSLSLAQEGNKVCRLCSGLYVHVYGNTRACSNMSLARACDFFDFVNSSTSVVDITGVNGIDVRPYIHSNSSLLYLDSSNTGNLQLGTALSPMVCCVYQGETYMYI